MILLSYCQCDIHQPWGQTLLRTVNLSLYKPSLEKQYLGHLILEVILERLLRWKMDYGKKKAIRDLQTKCKEKPD